MKNRQAFQTHHRNRTHAAIVEGRAKRLTNRGMKPGSKPSGEAVAYCSACEGPLVDSAAGRARHALKGGDCAVAMAEAISIQKKGPTADLR